MRLQFLPYNPSKDSYDLDETAEESPQQHAARVYHRKAKLLRKTASNSQKSAANRAQHSALKAKLGGGLPRSEAVVCGDKSSNVLATSDTTVPGPVTVLGAGRIDPFDSYCTSDHSLIIHEMLDHAISFQWTLFAPNDKPESLLMAKKAVMDTAIRFPVCFHTLVYSGATHKAFHQSPIVDNTRSALLRLKSKGEALKALRKASQSSETALSDGVIFAMALLAILGYGEKVTSVTKHEKRTMAAQQDGQFYASMEYEWQHWRALIEVVKMKGGLHTIQFPGLAFAIASFDIHTSMMFQTKPAFPLFMPSLLVTCSWSTSQPGSPAMQNLSALTSGFGFLEYIGLAEAIDLLSVLRGVRDITIAFDSYQHGEPEAPPIKIIIFARNLNQHELLTLPDLSEELYPEDLGQGSPPATPRQALALYELCRLCTFVFQMTVLLPNLHDSIDVTIPYAQRIRLCLQVATTNLSLHEDPAYRDVLLWATLMTAWLVKGTSLYDWFVDFLVEHVSAARTARIDGGTASVSKWPRVRNILSSFLWLDSECLAPCALIWEEVEASQIPDEKCAIC
ncbi:hypothetical protein A1O7_07610 [Cladophialophora yegresii CBS 114405]|uniref:Transcription factor domain-containing protein n=1 Tax=Cladophialophora yegresii CBS 114405 TaxID=1182544 RepID=W9VNY8_9EURO|nr:uncharacterized protein A1O7_07610 [Cladophialophora yegresii CBS 114405]EXJ57263.1 hypothetical protein A1O7_07610 [Cladophialophora yegresii CBS 114405]